MQYLEFVYMTYLVFYGNFLVVFAYSICFIVIFE